LEVDSELGVGAEEVSEVQCGIGGDRVRVVEDSGDVVDGNIDFCGEGVGVHVEGI